MAEQQYANQLQRDKLQKRRAAALNTQHIKDNISSNYTPVTNQSIDQGREEAAKKQRATSDPQGSQKEISQNEPQLANNLARQQVSSQIDNKRQNQDTPKKKQDTNKAGPMLKVAIAFCLVRDFVWLIAIIIAIIPLIITQYAGLSIIIIADMLCVLPLFTDRKFITFLVKDLIGIRKSKKGQLAKKGAKAAAQKIGLALREILLILLIFMPGYTFILIHYIKKYEKAPKEDSELSVSSLKGAIMNTQKQKNQRTSQLSAAVNASKT